MVATPFLQQPEKKSTTLMNDCLLMDEGFRTKLFLRSPNTKKELVFLLPCTRKWQNAYNLVSKKLKMLTCNYQYYFSTNIGMCTL